MINLCSYWDVYYHSRGVALLRSLARHLQDGTWHLTVLALDFETQKSLSSIMRNEPDLPLTVIPLAALETERLRAARKARSWHDYIFTLTPALVLHMLREFKLDSVAYVDSDLYLYGNLEPLYREVDGAEIAVIPHRWTPRLANKLRGSGEFNVGWVYWRNGPIALSCLDRWQEQCLAWQPNGSPFSDQVYLNDWPFLYRNSLHRVKHLGANLAPWNQEQYRYSFDSRLWIDLETRREPVLFYHFHGWSAEKRSSYYLSRPVVEHIYKPYEQEMAYVRQHVYA